MTTLYQYAHQNPQWTLEEFVLVLNQLLPQFLPDRLDASEPWGQGTSSKTAPDPAAKTPHGVRDTLTPRLVRHYTSQGLVDEPQKLGRSARYGYRHLLQLLLVRRLLREGYSTQVLQPLLQQKSNEALEALLQGGVQLTVTPANPALAFLEQIRQRSTGSLPPPAPKPPPLPQAPVPPPTFAPNPAAPAPPPAPQRSAPPSPLFAPCQPDPSDTDALDLDAWALSDAAEPDELAPDTAEPSYPQCSLWTRVVVMPDLEIQVGPNLPLPRSDQERQNLAAAIVQSLELLRPDRADP